MRFLTAGESHGEGLLAIVEGFPKGVKIDKSKIDYELNRRKLGFGRGDRMSIESDSVEFISGLRKGITLGSPIAMLIKNKDIKIFPFKEDNLEVLSIPRPAHADLSGALKYQEYDLRNILERASARETISRVCVGALCKQFLSNFNIKIASFTISVGEVESKIKPRNVEDIIKNTKNSLLNCIDKKTEKLMINKIKEAKEKKDTLGGIIEVWIENVPVGLGSFMHFDKRLDARLAFYLVSIPSIKGIEFGLGFEYAKNFGSLVHDKIYYKKGFGFFHKTNNSGGIEGGISTGEPIVIRLAAKPIATLTSPLKSVDLIDKKKKPAIVERSDTCVVYSIGVIAENLCAIVITEVFLEKFASDTLVGISENYNNYIKKLKKF